MPERCVVPGCNKPNGHRFPTDSEARLKWIQAIRRLKTDENGAKLGKSKEVLWEPKRGKEIVCKGHFLPSDYRKPMYGTIGEY